MMTLILEFWRLMRGYRKLFLLAGTALVIATGFQLAFPWLLRLAIDGLTDGTATRSAIYRIAAILMAVALGEGLFTYLKGRGAAAASEGCICDLRNRLFQHLMQVPFSVHGDFQAGDVIQRATSDIQTLGRFLNIQVTEVARTMCLLIGVTILLFSMAPSLAVYAVVLLPPIFLFSLIIFNRIRKRFEQVDETEAELSSIVSEYLSGVRVVKAFARERFEYDRFLKSNDTLVAQDTRLSYLHAMFWPTSDMLCMLQAAVVLLVGGLKALNGEITVGTFVAFNTYVMFLIWPIRHVGRLLGEMGRASVSLRRIREILDQPVEDMTGNGAVPVGNTAEGSVADAAANRPAGGPDTTTGKASLNGRSAANGKNAATGKAPANGKNPVNGYRIKGGVQFKKVSFGYEGTPVLNNISFRVKAGKTVAILGATGAGKTTLMKLLLRCHDDYSGTISVDGRDITEIPREALRAQVGYVLQEAFLFSRTIYDNIGFGVSDPGRKVVKRAAVAAAVDSFVRTFPKRYRTMVGERGVTLSGGQKQRIALARVLLKRPSILILDDTTSALDTETEAEIWKAMRKYLSGCTAFIITHRLSTAAGANKILVLDGGTIVQQGTHDELIRKPGLYRRLHEQQDTRHGMVSGRSKHGKAKRR